MDLNFLTIGLHQIPSGFLKVSLTDGVRSRISTFTMVRILTSTRSTITRMSRYLSLTT